MEREQDCDNLESRFRERIIRDTYVLNDTLYLLHFLFRHKCISPNSPWKEGSSLR